MPLPHPQTLQKLKVPIIDSRLCKSLYWQGAGQEAITEDMLCAGYLEGKKDACLVSAHSSSTPVRMLTLRHLCLCLLSQSLPRDILSHSRSVSVSLSGLFLVYTWVVYAAFQQETTGRQLLF